MAENMPAIIAAAAKPFEGIGNLTVLNGAEGLNGMLGSVMAQAATFLPELMKGLSGAKLPKSELKTGESFTAASPTTNGAKATVEVD
jgi:hypothetical protein